MHQINHSYIFTVLFQFVTYKGANQVLSDAENLTEERVDGVLNEFLKDIKEGVLETKDWDSYLSAYTLSKAALNAYTRIPAKKYPRFKICLLRSLNASLLRQGWIIWGTELLVKGLKRIKRRLKPC